MPVFYQPFETTSNANTGMIAQLLMPAGRDMKVLGVLLKVASTANPVDLDIGRIVLDRITAAGSTNMAAATPIESNPAQAGSALTNTTTVVATGVTGNTANGSGETVIAGDRIDLNVGWNDLSPYDLRSGAGQGFALARRTAPAGSRIVSGMVVWSE